MNVILKHKYSLFIVILSLFAAVVTVGSQFLYLYERKGSDYIISEDYLRHRFIVDGKAQAPHRYRLLTDYCLEIALRAVPINHPRKYELIAFIFRIIQNWAIFLLAYKYFRSFNFIPNISMLGILVLSYSMCFVFYQSDLSFYLYTQLAFFLVAGIIINLNCHSLHWLILALTTVAALNREEAVFIPVMFLIARLSVNNWRIPKRLKDLNFVVFAFILFFLIYFGLRFLLTDGRTDYAECRYGKIYPGIYLLWLNILNPRTWIGLGQAFSLLPFALLFVRKWPRLLKAYFLILVLPWFGLEFLFGSVDETRLFLVPLALVFVPAGLSIVSFGPETDWIKKGQ